MVDTESLMDKTEYFFFFFKKINYILKILDLSVSEQVFAHY